MKATVADRLHLREWRERRGLSQTELANRVGIHRVSLARLESGTAEPKATTVRSIAAALGVSVEALYRPPPVAARWEIADP